MKSILCYDLGRSPYNATWDLQKAIQSEIIDHKLRNRDAVKKNQKSDTPAPSDILLFVEHPHVYTLGKSGDAANLLRSNRELSDLDATYVKIDRGGDITYHGPGQIVGYPILDLDHFMTDIHVYLRNLEEVIIRTCKDYGITAGRIEKLTGVWIDGAKICAFGIKCSRWVTMHGFALNVNAHLDYFDHIIPCGIQDKTVCSMSSLLNKKIDESEVKAIILNHFGEVFGAEMKKSDLDRDHLMSQYGLEMISTD
ncbi:MAG TPA: lipoyl(octanoyl) transferase [Bacteroidetes bacterium]|nr:lipoyl(octanoyl) transferase [Bacteroidota bacterium]